MIAKIEKNIGARFAESVMYTQKYLNLRSALIEFLFFDRISLLFN